MTAIFALQDSLNTADYDLYEARPVRGGVEAIIRRKVKHTPETGHYAGEMVSEWLWFCFLNIPASWSAADVIRELDARWQKDCDDV